MSMRHVTIYLGVMLQVINCELVLVMGRGHKGVLSGCEEVRWTVEIAWPLLLNI